MLPIQKTYAALAKPALTGFGNFSRSDATLYAGHELVVWSVEWLAKPVFARQDRVIAVHNGTTEALGS